MTKSRHGGQARRLRRLFSGGLEPQNIGTPGSLAIWLDAADYNTLTFNATTISSWRNKGSAGAGNAAQATTLQQPLYVASGINGKPALEGRHDGVNPTHLAILDSAALNYTAFTQFIVMQRVSDSGLQEHMVGKWTTTGNQREQRLVVNSADLGQEVLSPDGTSTGNAAPDTNPTALAVSTGIILTSGFSAGTTTIRLNGGTLKTSAVAAAVFNGTGNYAIFSRQDSNAEPFIGRIAEVLFYTQALSASEEAKVRSYLSNKWGVALA